MIVHRWCGGGDEEMLDARLTVVHLIMCVPGQVERERERGTKDIEKWRRGRVADH
jgi:hypothetical protein